MATSLPLLHRHEPQPIQEEPPALADVSCSASTVNSLEMYNQLLGGYREAKLDAGEGELNLETCAICCSDLVLGPQQAITRMRIPAGELPRHFECGHALHSDCYAIYVCSAGRSCPICALDRTGAARARHEIRGLARQNSAAETEDSSPQGTRTPHREPPEPRRDNPSWDEGWDDGGAGEEEDEQLHQEELEMLQDMQQQEEMVLEAVRASLDAYAEQDGPHGQAEPQAEPERARQREASRGDEGSA